MNMDDMPGLYYDRQGQPITFRQWADLSESGAKRVAETTIGHLWVSTVWVGIDMGFHWGPDRRPIIFETMVFDEPGASESEAEWNGHTDRYSTEEEAMLGHQIMVAAIEAGVNPDRLDDEGAEHHGRDEH